MKLIEADRVAVTQAKRHRGSKSRCGRGHNIAYQAA